MKRLLAVYALVVFMMLAWGFGARAQLGSNTRTLKADVIDSNTASLIEFLKDIEISSTGYVLLPKGTTAQRPGTPTAGMFRYNTEENTFEGYTTEWGPIAGGGGLSEWTASTAYEADDVVFIKDDNVYKVYLAKTGFTSGGTFAESNWLELSKSRSDQNELLLDGSFEYGVFEWSCTNATVTQVAGGVDGDFQAQIDFTADGGFCTLTSTVTGDTADQEYLPRAYVKTSDATVGLEFLDGTRLVAEPEVLADGSYQSYAAQVIPSTSIVTKITGDNTDQAFIDAAGHTLGGFNRAPSKNCSSVLDCENKPGGFYDASSSSVTNQTPDEFVTAVAKSGTSSRIKEFTVKAGVFSVTPNCRGTGGELGNRVINYLKGSSTTTSLAFDTSNGGTSEDSDFSFECTKAPADYKTTDEKGVVTIPSNKDVRLSASNSSETTRTDVATTLTKIDLPDIGEIEGIEWDTGTSTGTAIQSGKYLMHVFAPFWNKSATGLHYATIEIDTGAGFNEINQAPCVVYTQTDQAEANSSACPFLVDLEKGDQFRVAAVSSKISTGFLTDLTVNGKNSSPKLTVIPLGGRQNIGEFAGTAVFDGESGTLTSGYASFGGTTDGSVCSASPCTRYREVGDLADNMSVTRSGAGILAFSISGFKASSPVFCDCNANVAGGSTEIDCNLQATELKSSTGGEVSSALLIYDTGGTNVDGYFQIKCEGPRP